MQSGLTKTTAKAILFASLAVASVSSAAPAQAQYMVIEGGSSTAKSDSQIICCQSMYVQDYSSVNGVNSAPTETENGLTSTAIISGLFDGYIGVFGAVIGIPAIIVAVLRFFVRGQTLRKPKKKSFELPAAPASTRFYRTSPAGKY